MPTFEARVKVVHSETWTVEAENEDEAREKFKANHADVDNDDAGGEVVDWTVGEIKKVK